MSDQAPDSDDGTIQRAKRFDGICDAFETQCSAGNRPSIESFLLRVDGPDKQPLLFELIAIEMHYRRQNGESIAFAEYQTRFPGLSVSRMEETIQLSEKAHSPKTPAADQPTIDSRPGQAAHGESKLVKYFGDYELLDVIARGGMGIVYRARQVSLNRIVALKMILSGEFASKQEVDRFYSEAKAAALLDHPGIVPIYEVGEHECKHFFSMTYVEGSSLAAKLNDGPLEPIQAAKTILVVSQAVHYAHEQGVIHRDLKPSNILLDTQGRPRVTDFGLAKRLTEDTGMTVSGQVLGTPSYMPPEQAAGQINTIGPASDVYALGAVLYSLTTGRPPFQSASSIDTLRQVVEKEPVAPRQLNSAIPRDLETIILKCLEKSLPRRYSSAKLLSDELQRFVEGRPIIARPIGRVAKVSRWCRRQPMVASLVTFVFLLLCTLAVGSSWAYLRELSLGNDLKVSLGLEKKAKNEAVGATNVAKEATKLANKATSQAEAARSEKERQAEIAVQEKVKAKASESNTRRNLYVSDAARVEELFKESNLNRAKILLERHIPKSVDEEDLRGFDWFYHWRQVKQEKAKFEFKKPVEVIDLSADERTLAVGCEGGRAYLVDVGTGKVNGTAFSLAEDHWSTVSFVGDDRLVGHGRNGSFKVWETSTGKTVANKQVWKSSDGATIVDRIPACVSKTGNRMIGCDGGINLALWTLNPIRPTPLPFINEGIHPLKQGPQVNHFEFMWSSTFSGHFRRSSSNPQLLLDTGLKTWDELLIRKRADELPLNYESVGSVFPDPYRRSLESVIGHPVTVLRLCGESTLVSGTVTGEVQRWDLQSLEDRQQWSQALPLAKSLSTKPIVDVSVSNDHRVIAACDERKCHVLRFPNLDLVCTLDPTIHAITKVQMVGNELLAIGMANGVVDVWRLMDSSRVMRFLTGTGSVTGIVPNQSNTQLYVSNSDGSVNTFELAPDDPPIYSSAGFQGEVTSLSWLANSKSVGFLRWQVNDLVVAETRAPNQSVSLQRQRKLVRQMQFGPLPVLFRERTRSEQLVTIHSDEVCIWNSKTWDLVKNVDYLNLYNDQSDEHSLSAKQLPYFRFEYKDGSISRVPNLDLASSQPPDSSKPRERLIMSADLFRDEKRLALMVDGGTANGPELTLLLRDIDTDAVICEAKITGLGCTPGLSTMICLDENRVLIDSLAIVGDGPAVTQSLLWDVTDNSIKTVDTSARIKQPAPMVREEIGGPAQAFKPVNKNREIAIWQNSMARVLDLKTLAILTCAKAPIPELIAFAHLDEKGDLFAVLRNAEGAIRWARWDRVSEDWQTVFEGKMDGRYAIGSLWCIDPSQLTLYYLRNPSLIERWNVLSGMELPPLRLPSGSVEQVRVDETGMMVALREAKVSGFESPWKISWFQDGIQTHSSEISQNLLPMKAVPYFFKVPSSSSWLTMEGEYPKENKSVRFKGKYFYRAPNSEALLSEDESCMVQCEGRTIHSWDLRDSPGEKWPFAYVFAESHLIAPSVPVDKSFLMPEGTKGLPANFNPIQSPLNSISPNGSKVASRVGSELFWSNKPFQDWKSIPLKEIGLATATSLKWSWDNSSIAIGASSGDILIHDTTSEKSHNLERGHQGTVHDMLWMPDHRTFASAGGDGIIVIWDLAQREIRLHLEAHRGAVKSLAFETKNKTLVSGGADGAIRRWAAPSLKPMLIELPTSFVAPDPTASILENANEPSEAVIRNRDLVQWLDEKKATNYSLSNFGVSAGLSGKRYTNDEIAALEELSVHTVSFNSNLALTDDDLSKFTGLNELRALNLANCKLTSFGLSKLTGLENLHTLNLNGIDLTGFDFNTLSSSTNLRVLWLLRCNVSDEQLITITKLFPQLRTLEISHSSLSDISVSKIDSLQHLKTLCLASTKMSGKSVSAIENLKKLEFLNLSDTKISGEDLSQLGSLKLLRLLRIQGVSSLDAWLSQLADWNHLKLLDIRSCDVSPDAIRAFIKRRGGVDVYVSPRLFGAQAELETLLSLGPLRGKIEIDGKPVDILSAIDALQTGGSISSLSWPIDTDRSNEDLSLLAKLPKLERIEISADAVPKIHFPVLPKIENLRELRLNRRPDYSEIEFKSIGDIQQLRNLNLEYINLKGVIENVQKLTNLESLEYVHGVGIDVLAPSLPKLRTLTCPRIKATELTKAIPFLQSLETLTIPESPDKDVVLLLAKLKNLEQVNIQLAIAAAELAKLQAELPGVTVVQNKIVSDAAVSNAPISDAAVSNTPIVEQRSLPSSETMNNRTTAKWLLRRGISWASDLSHGRIEGKASRSFSDLTDLADIDERTYIRSL